MPFITHVLAPGFSDNNLVMSHIISLTRITIIFMPLISIVAILGVVTNVAGKFWPFAFTPVILNLSLIISCFFIDDSLIIKSMPLSIGTVLAGFLQLIFMSIIIKKYKILNTTKAKIEGVSLKDKDEIQFYIKKTWYKFLPLKNSVALSYIFVIFSISSYNSCSFALARFFSCIDLFINSVNIITKAKTIIIL